MISALVAVALLVAPSPSTTPAGVGSMFGVNGCAWSHLGANDKQFDREKGLRRLQAVVDSGAKWDRCDFWWTRIEPEQGTFVWADYDWVIEQYEKAGVQVMPILCYASAWNKGVAPVTDDERQRYANFVYEVVKRYKGRVKAYEIWNEPNITPFWEPKPHAPDYVKLLAVAYAAAKKADPDVIVVGGVIAGIDYPFIEAMLKEGAAKHMDVFSFHPYQGDLGSVGPDEGNLAGQIQSHRALLQKYGFTGPIWITEIGHRTPGTTGNTWVSEEKQAEYVLRTYQIARENGVGKVFWFNLQDWEEHWGLIDRQFRRKPAFDAYRRAAEQK
jgi:hypothetical protein